MFWHLNWFWILRVEYNSLKMLTIIKTAFSHVSRLVNMSSEGLGIPEQNWWKSRIRFGDFMKTHFIYEIDNCTGLYHICGPIWLLSDQPTYFHLFIFGHGSLSFVSNYYWFKPSFVTWFLLTFWFSGSSIGIGSQLNKHFGPSFFVISGYVAIKIALD